MRPAVVMLSSSPGHDKLPAPGLARILAGSGSRGRAAVRSSPLFCSRSKSVGGSSAATQEAMAEAAGHGGEPISPKVTCIGQVRTRKKKSWLPPPPKASPPSKENARKPRKCFHKVFLCSLLAGRRKLKGWLPWWKWSRSGQYQGREPDSPRAPPLQFIAISGDEEEEFEDATQPPNDALLLMRCRSTPHNLASSLAASVRFAVSPLPEQCPQKAAVKDEREKGGRVELRRRTKNKKKGSERWCHLAAATEEMSDEEDEEEEGMGSESQRPLVLMRSRSEPARRQRASTRRASTVME